jgi:DNA-binding NarL/FixJ family response regulator
MPEVLEAQKVYKQADLDALAMRRRARALLGLAVVHELDRGATQKQIAERLCVVEEQVRRYRQAYRDWLRDHDGQPPA